MPRAPGPTGSSSVQDAPDAGTLVRLRSREPGPHGSRIDNSAIRHQPHRDFKPILLHEGSRGPSVEKLQALLNRRGAHLPEDGVFGPSTKVAVVAFQRSAGLKADGVAGFRTMAALNRAVFAASTTTSGGTRTSSTRPRTAAAPLSEAPSALHQTLDLNVHHWPPQKIIATVLIKAGQSPRLSAELRAQWNALLSPTSRNLMIASVIFLAVGHLLGYGEVLDGVFLVFGIVTTGAVAFEGGKEFGDFLVAVTTAATEKDLDRAADHLARAIVLLGITTIMSLMLKGSAAKAAPRVADEGVAAFALDEVKLKSLVIEVWNDQRPTLVKVVSAERGPSAGVGGYITNEKFIAGRTPAEMERILGLKRGELGDGAHVMRLNRLPTSEEFELRGYTNTPDGKTYVEGVSNPDYPPGLGAPQWQLKRGVQIPSTPVKFVGPADAYRPMP